MPDVGCPIYEDGWVVGWTSGDSEECMAPPDLPKQLQYKYKYDSGELPEGAGCTDPEAVNYDPLATCEDGSCVIPAADCENDDCLVDFS